MMSRSEWQIVEVCCFFFSGGGGGKWREGVQVETCFGRGSLGVRLVVTIDSNLRQCMRV